MKPNLEVVYQEDSEAVIIAIPVIRQPEYDGPYQTFNEYSFQWKIRVYFIRLLNVAIIQLDQVCARESRFDSKEYSKSTKILFDCDAPSFAIRKAIEMIDAAKLEPLPIEEKTIEQAWEEYHAEKGKGNNES